MAQKVGPSDAPVRRILRMEFARKFQLPKVQVFYL